MEKIIPPYVRDKEHSAPRHILVQAYPQLSAHTLYGMEKIERRAVLREQKEAADE